MSGEDGVAHGDSTSNSSIVADSSMGTLRVSGNGTANASAFIDVSYGLASAKLIVLVFELTDFTYAYSADGQLSGECPFSQNSCAIAAAKLTKGSSTIFEVSASAADSSPVTLSQAGQLSPGIYTLTVDLNASARGFENLFGVYVRGSGNFNFALDPLAPTPTPTPGPTASPTPTPASPAQALNISTRLRVETGSSIAIGGFIVTGGPKKVAIRGIGPSLANSGLSDVLADPTLELRTHDNALVTQNDNWQDNSSQAAQLIELGLAPQHPNESGIVATLQPGAYTALLAGKNQTSGLALVEVYDADAAANSQLANISTRGFVRTGSNVMIGGFVLGNSATSTNVIARGLGPSLSQVGLSNVLADPTLELRDSNGAVLIANDNWQDDSVSAAQLTARGLAPSRIEESGIFANLPPGAFTVILAGKNGGTGLGLVEVYNVQ